MRRFLRPVLALLMLASLVSPGCRGPSGPGGVVCALGLCVDLRLVEPIRFNEPAPAVITVEAKEDNPGLRVYLVGDSSVELSPEHTWTVDLAAGQTAVFTGTVTFTEEGYCTVLCDVQTRYGGSVMDSVVAHVTRAGVTLNPVVPMDLGSPPPGPTPVRTVTWRQLWARVQQSPRAPIPDDGTWLNYSIPITSAPASATVSGVNVKLSLHHPRGQDLVAEVIGPDGTTVQRFWDRRVPEAGDLADGYLLLRLQGSHVFDGLPCNGTWTLRLRDEVAGEAGTWEELGLQAGYLREEVGPVGEPPPTEPSKESSAPRPQGVGAWHLIATEDFEGLFPWEAGSSPLSRQQAARPGRTVGQIGHRVFSKSGGGGQILGRGLADGM